VAYSTSSLYAFASDLIFSFSINLSPVGETKTFPLKTILNESEPLEIGGLD